MALPNQRAGKSGRQGVGAEAVLPHQPHPNDSTPIYAFIPLMDALDLGHITHGD